MKAFLNKLLKIAGYSAAVLLILLAIIVGLFRLFLPRLPEYQEDIKAWASDAIGMHVEFDGMNARWGLSGPELEFYNALLVRPDSDKQVIAAERVGIGVSVASLLFDQALVVDRLTIRDTLIEIRQLEDGQFLIQDSPVSDMTQGHRGGARRLGNMQIVGQDIEVLFLQPGDQQPRRLRIPQVLASIDERRIAVDTTVRLSEDLGRQLTVSATRLLDIAEEERSWDISVGADNLLLEGVAALHPSLEGRLLSGGGDIELALVVAGRTVRHATADIDISGVSISDTVAFDIYGRLEYDMSSEGWLVAAEDFGISTQDGEWPESSLRVEASTDANGDVVMLDLRASYLKLEDGSLFAQFLPQRQREQLAELSPAGIVRDLGATISHLGSDEPEFHVEAEVDDFGVAATEKWPGFRGFSGYISGNRAGGRLEIRSTDLLVELPRLMDQPLDFDTATGTLLWRRSDGRTTILSDSIRITNPALDSRNSIQLTLGDGATDIDLNGTFRISDVGAARRYVPSKIMKPKLYNWFQTSLVAGSIESGSVRLRGPLDKFPFDNDEGRFLLAATTRNLTLKYHPNWPAAEQADVDFVIDNVKLYSVRNRSVHGGSRAVDAEISIADLRQPVLRIEGLITGTLETLRQFSLQSPINGFTGGNLERISVAGDASFNLDLTVPLKNAKAATVNGLLRSNNGTLAVAGFNAPITDLIGEVTITREQISSETLGGRFLGEDLRIRVGPDEDPQIFAIATATGTATSTGIIEEIGLPLQGLIEGATPFEARILFPRGAVEDRPPFTVSIESQLQGFELRLPEPLEKPADEALLLRGDIRFPPGGESIESTGSTEDGIAWQLVFARPEGVWDLDRGVIQAGGGSIEAAETRGLHLRGRTDTVRLEEWLSVSRASDTKLGAASRIRSVDLVVDDLFAIGQHLTDHRVRVDRSARDWLVQVEGEDVTGSLFVPYDFGSDRAMIIEMDRMRLPGDEVTPPSDEPIDPRALPPITLTAKEFALKDRFFGAVDASLVRIEEGLVTERLTATDDATEIVASGRWVVDADDALGSRTSMTATLNSTNVGQTMERLDFARGITGEKLGIELDLTWGGGPRADFMDVLDGEVLLRLENGQLEDVEPGAGRMLGLVSFVALPRRLSLDFRDVFNKGFGYDSIAGTFNIEDGIASTCDMSLQGPAADVGIVGRVNLVSEEYEQGAVISANVGNTLPLVGAVVGGPPGAAAMLLFSQIFKKPLQEVGQVFYSMSGKWDDPAIDSINSDSFVEYAELANCLADAEPQ
jgi:uncharacterized protein (TIGR02099 family)